MVNQALAEMRKASWSPQKWAHAIQLGYRGTRYRYENTHNFKAQLLLWQAAKSEGVDPPPSAFQSRELQNAYIQMKAAYWDPAKWCRAIELGYKGAPYRYTYSRNWYAQVDLWDARHAGPNPLPPPPPPPPAPEFHPNPLLTNVAVGAFSPWDALQWPGCRILISADPGPATSRWVSRETADHARNEGHAVNVWYVPDQVSHERAVEVCDQLGCDPANIVADCETLNRWQIAYHSGVKYGIYNLSAIAGNEEAERVIRSREFQGMNEFYWNQSKNRRPDNHNLPVDSMQIAVYNGHSDSQEPDAWEPHIPDYKANTELAGFWPTIGAYQQNMTLADWQAMPRPK